MLVEPASVLRESIEFVRGICLMESVNDGGSEQRQHGKSAAEDKAQDRLCQMLSMLSHKFNENISA